MSAERLVAVAVAAIALVACGPEEGAPEPAVPTAKASAVRPSRPPPNCRVEREPDTGVPLTSPRPMNPENLRPISDAEVVIESLRAQFRACYQEGLRVDASLDGCVLLDARVDPDGTVSSVGAIRQDRLSAQVGTCVADVLRNARFPAPGGAGARLHVPITFVQKQ